MGGSNYWLVLTLATYCSCYDLCAGNRNCSCQETGWQQWHVRCFNEGYLEITMQMISEFKSFFQVRCNQSNIWYEAYLQVTKLSTEERSFSFDGCSLFDKPFSTIFRRLGYENAIILLFVSSQKLGRGLTRRHLSGLSTLGSLHLPENGLTELPNDLLRDLPELELLRLHSNEITSLPRDIFEGVPRLAELYLNHNKIEVLDPMLFRNCTALSTLDVSKNRLTTLDHRIFHGLLDLTYLNLADNPLAITSNDMFESLKGLRELYISGCLFSSLPDELFHRMESIRILKLCDNRGNLTTLPKQLFNNPTSPFDVYLERNRFSRLTEDTFRGGIQLRFLVLTGNAFSTLPENIFNDLAKLVSLDLSENGLTDLPDGLFRDLQHLMKLNLSRNGITSLSTLLFAELHLLQELDLSFNRIYVIHEDLLKNLVHLRIARFSHNSIGFVGEARYLSRFKYCWNLRTLFLDHNNFTRLSLETWDAGVPSALELVDLSYNRISIVTASTGLPAYLHLIFDLRHNYVQQLFREVKTRAKFVFMLDNNPIHCNCRLYMWNGSIKRGEESEPKTGFTIIPGNAECVSPEALNGTRIADLNWESFLCHPRDEADKYIRCADECDCWWRPSDEMRVVDCSSRNLIEIPDKLMEFSDDSIPLLDNQMSQSYAWSKCPTELRLEKNQLKEIPSFNESIYESVIAVSLSFNHFSVVSRIFLPPRLRVLRLEHCNLRKFEAAALDVIMNSIALREVNLDGNPWECHRNTRNALLAIENKFGRVTKYPSGSQSCLDPGRVPHMEKEHSLRISYTRF